MTNSSGMRIIFSFALMIMSIFSVRAIASPVVTCTGVQTASYSPGMNNEVRTIDVKVDTAYMSCVHLQPLPKIMSGYSHAEALVDVSCNDFGVPVPSQRTIHWSNGQKSNINYISTVSIVDGQVVVTYDGVVASGLYAGSSVMGSVTATAFIGNEAVDALVGCSTEEGISGNSGPATLIISPTL